MSRRKLHGILCGIPKSNNSQLIEIYASNVSNYKIYGEEYQKVIMKLLLFMKIYSKSIINNLREDLYYYAHVAFRYGFATHQYWQYLHYTISRLRITHGSIRLLISNRNTEDDYWRFRDDYYCHTCYNKYSCLLYNTGSIVSGCYDSFTSECVVCSRSESLIMICVKKYSLHKLNR